jgi:hypothetical protein
MTRFRNERGQTLVMSVLFLWVLLGMGALVLDVGAWYRADRDAQTAADAAALAAAQELPDSPAQALDAALSWGEKNGGGIEAADVSFSPSKYMPNDTVYVEIDRPSPGFFAKLFGIETVTVGAKAAARAGTPAEALYVAPIVVNEQHEMIQRSCFGTPKSSNGCDTELSYYHLKEDAGKGPDKEEPDGAGSFGFINLTGDDSNPGTSELGSWITSGYDKYMPLGDYHARTGNPFSSTNVGDSLSGKIGEELLFPIYRKIVGTGSGAKYEIIGWVGFHLTGTDLHGTNEKLLGYFTRVVWTGIQGSTGSSFSPGVRVVELVD